MKKIIFSILCFMISFNIVQAFEIDIDKIQIGNNNILSNLDATYKIDTLDFKKQNYYNEEIKTLTEQLLNISFSDKEPDEKLSDFNEYIYISNDGFETLGSSLFIKNYLDQIKKDNISYESIKLIRTVEFDDGIISFSYLKNAKINEQKQNIVIAFLFKKYNNTYKVHMPWITTEEEINKRYNDILDLENNNNVYGGTFKEISLNEKTETIEESTIQDIYNNHKNEVCQINAISENEITTYGSCFFIKEGVIVTSWSLFLNYLANGNYLYVNDYNSNAYNVLGVVSANIEYDIVVLKIDSEVGNKVTFGDSHNLKTNDKLFMINSLNNVNSTITYGTFISFLNGKLKNLFLINQANIGSALYNINGEVVAFTTGELINSELSYANSTNYIIKLQEILNNQEYNNIQYTSLDFFKNRYFLPLNEEKIINNINEETWNKYKTIGDIENTIPLKLIKANYEDHIISLRYKNNIGNSIDTIYLLENFSLELEKDNFKNTLTTKNKLVYKNKKYEVIIKNSMDYLCILIMEI